MEHHMFVGKPQHLTGSQKAVESNGDKHRELRTALVPSKAHKALYQLPRSRECPGRDIAALPVAKVLATPGQLQAKLWVKPLTS